MEPEDRLSHIELLSSLTGDRAARAIFAKYESLTALARASFAELDSIPGVGPARASAIRSAFHLGKRLTEERLPERPIIETPDQVAELVRGEFQTLNVERFVVILLNARRRLIGVSRVTPDPAALLEQGPAHAFEQAGLGRGLLT